MIVRCSTLKRLHVAVERRQRQRSPGLGGVVSALGQPLAATSTTRRHKTHDDSDKQRCKDRGDTYRSAEEHNAETLTSVITAVTVLNVTMLNQSTHRVSWVVLVRDSITVHGRVVRWHD